MFKPISSQLNTIWIAIIAVLFAALLPGLNQIFDRGTKHSQLIAICTSTGMKYIQVSKTIESDEKTDVSRDSTERSFCQITQHMVGLIDCPSRQLNTSIAKFELPAAPEHAAFTSPQWGLPKSRAPPQTA